MNSERIISWATLLTVAVWSSAFRRLRPFFNPRRVNAERQTTSPFVPGALSKRAPIQLAGRVSLAALGLGLSIAVTAAQPTRELSEALAKEDLAAVRLAVAAARQALGPKAGEPEVADTFLPIPKAGRWLTAAEARRGFQPDFGSFEKLIWWRVGLDPTTLTQALRGPASFLGRKRCGRPREIGRRGPEPGLCHGGGGFSSLGAGPGRSRGLSVSCRARRQGRQTVRSRGTFSGPGRKGGSPRSSSSTKAG